MTAAHLNFDNQQAQSIEQGATFEFPFIWEDSVGAIIDISFYEAKMQIRKNFGGPLVAELSTDNGKITIDSNNELMLRLSAEETQLLPPGKYLYDLELTDTFDGTVYRLIEGEIYVSPEVTV